MNITFYINQSENNTISKKLQLVKTVSGTLRNETDLINPVLSFSGEFPNANYLYIEEFSRYYFINGFRSIRQGLFEVSCHVDVLYTYKDQILKQYAIINKQERIVDGSKYVNDGSYVPSVKQYTNSYNFFNSPGYTNFLNTPEYILITAGGGN